MNSAGQGLGKGFCLIYKVQRNEVLKRVQQDKDWDVEMDSAGQGLEGK